MGPLSNFQIHYDPNVPPLPPVSWAPGGPPLCGQAGRTVRWSVERVRRSDRNRFASVQHDLPPVITWGKGSCSPSNPQVVMSRQWSTFGTGSLRDASVTETIEYSAFSGTRRKQRAVCCSYPILLIFHEIWEDRPIYSGLTFIQALWPGSPCQGACHRSLGGNLSRGYRWILWILVIDFESVIR
jgi:hypothetical protein